MKGENWAFDQWGKSLTMYPDIIAKDINNPWP